MVDAPIVVLETSMGTMVVQLDRVRAPITVENFTNYVGMGFYDGTIFHRVIDNFVIQGGGYEPGLVLKETLGPIPLEIHPELRHLDGAIAMARSQEPDTAESQFYITDNIQPGLDDNYAVFGVLIDGFPVRDAITQVPTGNAMWMGFELMDVPLTDVILESAYCVESWP
jgi:cyclophilin family peptidyl-prolyl cis-trans isomerase